MEHIALIMAAGEGVRMQSDLPKVLHPLCGKAMLQHVMDTVGKVCATVVPILGHGRADIVKVMGDFPHSVQDFSTGKGTGHAVLCATEHLKGKKGCVIVTAGDMPLVTKASYQALFDAVQFGAAAALLYADLPDPFGYGRVIIGADGKVQGIVEQKDLSAEQKGIQACNASVYCFDIESLLWALPRIENHNAANEYYLTDTIGILAKAGRLVAPVSAQDHDECRGINTRVQLEEATRVLRGRINRKHMLAGVTLLDAQNTYVDVDVEIGRDTVLYPGTVIEAGSKIGARCTLYPGCHIRNSNLGDGVTAQNAVIQDCVIPDGTCVGPFEWVKPSEKVCRV